MAQIGIRLDLEVAAGEAAPFGERFEAWTLRRCLRGGMRDGPGDRATCGIGGRAAGVPLGVSERKMAMVVDRLHLDR
jgi:hypothetical protein